MCPAKSFLERFCNYKLGFFDVGYWMVPWINSPIGDTYDGQKFTTDRFYLTNFLMSDLFCVFKMSIAK